MVFVRVTHETYENWPPTNNDDSTVLCILCNIKVILSNRYYLIYTLFWFWLLGMGKKKYCAIYIQTKRYCLFGSCFTDIFFKFLSLLIPEWRQFKWFKLNWHVINQGWFLSLFKGFVKYMYGIWTKLCSYYKIQHLFTGHCEFNISI